MGRDCLSRTQTEPKQKNPTSSQEPEGSGWAIFGSVNTLLICYFLPDIMNTLSFNFMSREGREKGRMQGRGIDRERERMEGKNRERERGGEKKAGEER